MSQDDSLTMPWDEDYITWWDALVNLVKDLKDDTNNPYFEEGAVYDNAKHDPHDHIPCAFVIPKSIEIRQASFMFNDHTASFDIAVHYDNDDSREGYLKVFKLIGKIYDAIRSDPLLGGVCYSCEPTKITPFYLKDTQGMESFWAGMTVIVKKTRR